jgi:CheY-like chemotaxis protein
MVLNQGDDELDRFTYLGATYNIVLIHEAADALSFIKRLPVDVILLKDQMSGMDAMEFLMNLQDLRPSATAVVLCRGRVPATLPEMPNVCFLKEPISGGELYRFLTELESSPRHFQRTH